MACGVAVAAWSDPPIVRMAMAAGFCSGCFTANGEAAAAVVVAVVVAMVAAGFWCGCVAAVTMDATAALVFRVAAREMHGFVLGACANASSAARIVSNAC